MPILHLFPTLQPRFRGVLPGGYPKPLIDAHQYSTFFAGDAIMLLSDLVVRTGLHVREEPSLAVLFQPFGAFGK